MANRKTQLVEQLMPLIETEIRILQKSLDSASEAATHPESKPENKYDTRGLEASYLAGAQRERLNELKNALFSLQNMVVRDFTADDRIAPTALVELEQDGRQSSYFLLPLGAGFMLQWEGKPVQVLTPQSPLGQALLHKNVGDAVKIRAGSAIKEYEILQVL
ncbi:MAG TPA: GreA/GreB family elongation factor [Oligoflexus sp.]|uniref:GreA/GreB family elongation factor n=1 Tax=Oligoflexus sp. TaxID=1971216 RepID=UPI002D44BA5F|nr:GreA/GreB family elongation factor [Oligoflexus sp.]HYX36345.1 GreA/GreB family elongation factor [Oligoflexus sp.]